MSRKKKVIYQPQPVASVEAPSTVSQSFNPLFPSGNYKLLAGIVFILAFGIYFNSISNGYALDDGIVITENAFTKKGIAGIRIFFLRKHLRL